MPGVFYRSFCDASGSVRDSFAMAIAHAEDRVAVLDCLLEIRPPFNPKSQAILEAADALKAYKCNSTVGDKKRLNGSFKRSASAGSTIAIQSAIGRVLSSYARTHLSLEQGPPTASSHAASLRR